MAAPKQGRSGVGIDTSGFPCPCRAFAGRKTGKVFCEASAGRKARRAFTDNESLPMLAKAYFLFNIAPTKIHLKVKRKKNNHFSLAGRPRYYLDRTDRKEVSPLIIQFNRETVSRESGYFPIKPLPRCTTKINEHNKTWRSRSAHPRRQSG